MWGNGGCSWLRLHEWSKVGQVQTEVLLPCQCAPQHRSDLAFPQTLPGGSLGAGTVQEQLLRSCTGRFSLVWEEGTASDRVDMSWATHSPVGPKCKPWHRRYLCNPCLPILLLCHRLIFSRPSWDLPLQNYTCHYLCLMVVAIPAHAVNSDVCQDFAGPFQCAPTTWLL